MVPFFARSRNVMYNLYKNKNKLEYFNQFGGAKYKAFFTTCRTNNGRYTHIHRIYTKWLIYSRCCYETY